MWIFPLGAAAVSGYFAFLLAAQFGDRRRPNLLAWAISLAMFAGASAAAGIGLLSGWNEATFRVYYLFGAILNVPVLGLGTVYLLASRRTGHICAVIVAVAALYATVVVFAADLDPGGLSTDGIPKGSEVLPASARALSRYYSITGFVVVVGGALWSALKLGRRPGLRRLVGANILIAAGTTVVAGASEIARIAEGPVEGSIFAVGLFAGVSLMFAGFLRTRPPRPT